MSHELTVLCFYWHDETRKNRGHDYTFTHDHVRILQSMVKRNLSIPHRFVCVTDDNINNVDTIPLDWSKHVPGTVFLRLQMRKPDFMPGERILSLDIDMVLVDDITPLVQRNEPSVFWRNPNFPLPGRAFYQSSVQLFTGGTCSELYTEFDPATSPAFANRRFGGAEQAWISEMLPWDLPYWDHFDGIYGAGRLGGAGITTELPDNARLVSFPGNREPGQEAVQEKHPWAKEHYK